MHTQYQNIHLYPSLISLALCSAALSIMSQSNFPRSHRSSTAIRSHQVEISAVATPHADDDFGTVPIYAQRSMVFLANLDSPAKRHLHCNNLSTGAIASLQLLICMNGSPVWSGSEPSPLEIRRGTLSNSPSLLHPSTLLSSRTRAARCSSRPLSTTRSPSSRHRPECEGTHEQHPLTLCAGTAAPPGRTSS